MENGGGCFVASLLAMTRRKGKRRRLLRFTRNEMGKKICGLICVICEICGEKKRSEVRGQMSEKKETKTQQNNQVLTKNSEINYV